MTINMPDSLTILKVNLILFYNFYITKNHLNNCRQAKYIPIDIQKYQNLCYDLSCLHCVCKTVIFFAERYYGTLHSHQKSTR